MDLRNNQLKYRGNKSASFADEIIFGNNSIISQNQINHADIDLIAKSTPKNGNKQESLSQNYLFSFLLVSFSLIAFMIVFSKIVSSTLLTFNSITTSVFVGGYFLLFITTIFILLKRKTITLEIKDKDLHIKSFPALYKKIPVNQILKCELNTLKNDRFLTDNKIHFALNEDRNRYKQKLTSGISLQLINGQHIIIASHKS